MTEPQTCSPRVYDYVVVGSGAGGAPLAARLAEAGMRVLVLEAGGDPRENPPDADVYDVPAFHQQAAENSVMNWPLFVDHYDDQIQQRRDPKSRENGIFYPRAGTLGGCTSINALRFMRPPNSIWEAIARESGDASWQASDMDKYFERVEDCRHRPAWRTVHRGGFTPTGHGWAGWVPTEHPSLMAAARDPQMYRSIMQSVIGAGSKPAHVAKLLNVPRWLQFLLDYGLKTGLNLVPLGGYIKDGIDFLRKSGAIKHLAKATGIDRLTQRLWWQVDDALDPNDIRRIREQGGLCYIPLSTRNGRRVGARERLLEACGRHPDRLHIELHALATRIVLDDNNRAKGVEYLKCQASEGGTPGCYFTGGESHTALVTREVILAAGAFNSPQILMLSGIGPRQALERLSIPVRVASENVGRNLQDCYEISVVNRMTNDWSSLAEAKFKGGDRPYQQWARHKAGIYNTSGTMLAFSRKSSFALGEADLLCQAIQGKFVGYYEGYSRDLIKNTDYLTWTISKTNSNNRAGEVTLRSSDPRDAPLIKFRYFAKGDDEDIRSLVEGIRFVRDIHTSLVRSGISAEEYMPGSGALSDERLSQYCRDHAWGNLASSSCAIGADDSASVLKHDFSVRGTHGLRVVDASVFPQNPGPAMMAAIYMIAEKASDIILKDASPNSIIGSSSHL